MGNSCCATSSSASDGSITFVEPLKLNGEAGARPSPPQTLALVTVNLDELDEVG